MFQVAELLGIYDVSIIENSPYTLYKEWGDYIKMKDDMNSNDTDKPENLLNKGPQGLIEGLTL